MPNLGASFDIRLGKWLPVPRQQVSPDGTTYAYIDYAATPLTGPHPMACT